MCYVEVTTQLFVFLFAQDHLGAHIGYFLDLPHRAIKSRPDRSRNSPKVAGIAMRIARRLVVQRDRTRAWARQRRGR
jgi:hypothetical protein